MAGLSNVIGQLEASKILLEEKRLLSYGNDRSCARKLQIATKLKKGLRDLDVKTFHEQRLQCIYKQNYSVRPETLCTEVAMALERAVEQIWFLQQWASRQEEGNLNDGQTLALNAIHHLIRSFREFEVIPANQDLLGEPNKECVLQYLRKALQSVATLSPILGPWWHDLYNEMKEHLDSFHFDHINDYKRAENPTLQGVIDDHRFVPSNHLPAHPGRPIIYRYNGLGRPEILYNQPE